MSECEEENPYFGWRCQVCGNRGEAPCGSRKQVVCEWRSFMDGPNDIRGCGQIVQPHSRELYPPQLGARNAALTFLWCGRFGDNAALRALGKDMLLTIARALWSTRDDPVWMCGWTPDRERPKMHFRRSSGQWKPCTACKQPVYVWSHRNRWPRGFISCGACGTVIRSRRAEHLQDKAKLKWIAAAEQSSSSEEEDVMHFRIPSDAE